MGALIRAARHALGAGTPVVGDDGACGYCWTSTVPSGSAAIVRVGPNRQVELTRSGINDGGSPGFLRELAQRWVTNGRS